MRKEKQIYESYFVEKKNKEHYKTVKITTYLEKTAYFVSL